MSLCLWRHHVYTITKYDLEARRDKKLFFLSLPYFLHPKPSLYNCANILIKNIARVQESHWDAIWNIKYVQTYFTAMSITDSKKKFFYLCLPCFLNPKPSLYKCSSIKHCSRKLFQESHQDAIWSIKHVQTFKLTWLRCRKHSRDHLEHQSLLGC